MWPWRKKEKRLSKVMVNEFGRILTPYEEKTEKDFTIFDFIELLYAGTELIDAIIRFNKENEI